MANGGKRDLYIYITPKQLNNIDYVEMTVLKNLRSNRISSSKTLKPHGEMFYMLFGRMCVCVCTFEIVHENNFQQL